MVEFLANHPGEGGEWIMDQDRRVLRIDEVPGVVGVPKSGLYEMELQQTQATVQSRGPL